MIDNTTRVMVRPSRARIALARLSALMENTRVVSAVFMVLGIALLGSLAIVTDTTSAPIVFVSFALASSALAVLGASLVADITQPTARKQHRETLKRYISHYSQELAREVVARQELQKLLAQVEYDAKLERENLEHNMRGYKRDLANSRQNHMAILEKLSTQDEALFEKLNRNEIANGIERAQLLAELEQAQETEAQWHRLWLEATGRTATPRLHA